MNGPLYRAIADDPDKVSALDAALTDLAARHLADGTIKWEYLLVKAERNSG